ncbi:MAG TPA: thiamine pyrophosphate-binding protein [Smithellaceae bacterium]|nr:thiamine pyrophosphate-binding protein [Smithellaceae bacterium]
MKLSDYVMQFIARQGIEHIFYLPGGGAMHLVDSLGKLKDVESVCCLHEQAVAIAAQSYAMHTNHLGVGLVTTGPGGTNAITGVCAAWIDSVPCLFVSGQVKRSDMMTGKRLRQLGIQEADIVTMVHSITKYAITVKEPTSIRYHLEKAIYLAKKGRPGPVWIDIPLDVQGTIIDETALEGFNTAEIKQKKPEASFIKKAVGKIFGYLNKSERPIIIAGDGIKISKSKDLFLEIINHLDVPVVPTWKAMDMLHEKHGLYAGRCGILGERSANFAVQNSDLLLCIGSKMDFTQTGFDTKSFARAARKIVIDIDKNEIKKLEFKVDLKIIADAGLVLKEIADQLNNLRVKDRSDWKDKIKQWRKKYPIVSAEYYTKSGLVNPYMLIDVLSREATSDDVINPCCAGTAAEYNFQAFKIKENQKFITNHGLGPMGFELPGSIGACLANHRKRTICVAGDGGFQLNIQELETLRRLNLPVKIFIMNNNGYSSIRTMQETHFGGHHVGNDPSSGLTLPDIISVAGAYRIKAIRIHDASELQAKVKEALEFPGPVVCDVMVIPGFKVSPKVAAQRREDGTMVSKPLEDQWPFLDRKELASNMMIPLVAE